MCNLFDVLDVKFLFTCIHFHSTYILNIFKSGNENNYLSIILKIQTPTIVAQYLNLNIFSQYLFRSIRKIFISL